MSLGRDVVCTFGVRTPFLYLQCALLIPSTVAAGSYAAIQKNSNFSRGQQFMIDDSRSRIAYMNC